MQGQRRRPGPENFIPSKCNVEVYLRLCKLLLALKFGIGFLSVKLLYILPKEMHKSYKTLFCHCPENVLMYLCKQQRVSIQTFDICK